MTKIFFDTEFTGLHQTTTLISIGLVAETGQTFYAELTDYDQSQVNDWLRDNVLAHLVLADRVEGMTYFDNDSPGGMATVIRGSKGQIVSPLTQWLAQFGKVQMWSDCLAYDWVLLNALLADYTNGYPQLPDGVHYIPMDICPLFQLKGIDPDISREKFGLGTHYLDMPKHNALWDAQVIKDCYDKLIS